MKFPLLDIFKLRLHDNLKLMNELASLENQGFKKSSTVLCGSRILKSLQWHLAYCIKILRLKKLTTSKIALLKLCQEFELP